MQNKPKRLLDRKTILIMILAFALLIGGVIALFIFGKISQNARNGSFSQGDGYIISSALAEDGSASTRQYFNSATQYRTSLNGNIEFVNTNGESAQVDPNSFIHYLDGSIGILKKSAILNLSTLQANKDSVITYYNLLPPTTLKRSSSGYVAELQGKQTTFKSIIIRIAENKFLIAAPEIEIHIGDTTNKISNSYFEITYFDGDIIRIENQELTYQNISKNVDIIAGDVHLDLPNRLVFKDGIDVLALDLITIDSNDNIALSDYTPEKEEVANEDNAGETTLDGTPAVPNTAEEPPSSTNSENTKDTSSQSQTTTEDNQAEAETENLLNDLANGIIETNTVEGEINEYERSSDPVFIVSSLDITTNSVYSVIDAQDTDGVLTGDTHIEIVNIATGQAVYQNRFSNGESSFEIHTENLLPETNYALTVTAGYNKDETVVNRTFIQKTFLTEAVGINLQENYTSTDDISIRIEKSDYSRVGELSAAIYNSNGEKVYSEPVEFGEEKFVDVNFEGLSHDSDYEIRLEDFHYLNAIVSTSFSISDHYKTLKRKPTLGQPNYVIDKRNATFSLNIGDTIDPDNGITGYRYEVYDARNINDSPIYTVNKAGRGSVEVPVDGNALKRGDDYVFRVIAEFNDNVRDYELVSPFAAKAMSLEGAIFPSIRFDEDVVTFERISGDIIIIDDGGVIEDDAVINITYTDSLGGGGSYTASGLRKIHFEQDNLRKKETYTITVSAPVDMKDGNQIGDQFIGSIVLQTRDTNPLQLNYNVNQNDTANAFSISARLANGNEGDTELEANTLSALTFNIYEGRDTTGRLIRSSAKIDTNVDAYVSDLKATYYDDDFLITPKLFGMKNSDFATGFYTVEVTNAYDYTTHKNPIAVKNNTVTVQAASSAPDAPTHPDNAIEVTPIYNSAADQDHHDPNLADDTIVGYSIRGEINNANRSVRRITYTLHSKSGETIGSPYEQTVSPDTTNIEAVKVYFDGYGTPFSTQDRDFRRGNEGYYFTFSAKLDQDNNGIYEDWPSNGATYSSKKISPEKQAPSFHSYPVNSDANTSSWKYSLSDPDQAIINNTGQLSYSLDGVPVGSITIEDTSGEFKDLKFTELHKGKLSAYFPVAFIKDRDHTSYPTVIDRHDFEGIYSLNNPSYTVSTADNRVTFTFNDYGNNTIYERIASVHLDLETREKTLSYDNLEISDSGSIQIDLSSIAELIGQDITPHLTFYYDSGVTGFGINNEYVAVKRQYGNTDYDYLSINANKILTNNTTAMGSRFKYSYDETSTRKYYKLEDARINWVTYINADIGTGGIVYDRTQNDHENYIILKGLDAAEATMADGPTFKFTKVVPGVSLLNEDGETTIIPELDAVTVRAKVYGASEENILDNSVYVELYKTNKTGIGSEHIGDYVARVNNDAIDIRIDGLTSNTNYYVKLIGYVNSSDGYERAQLYDIDQRTTDNIYAFKTLATVEFSDSNDNDLWYYARSQAERTFKFNFEISSVIGYDYLEYELWKVDSEGNELEKVNLDFGQDTNITADGEYVNEKELPIPSGSGVTTGSYYRVKMIPYSVKDGTAHSLEPGYTKVYYFNRIYNPYIGVNSTENSAGDKLIFTVLVNDYRGTVVDRIYTISIHDKQGNDVTPEQYNEPHVIQGNRDTERYTINKDSLNDSEEYTLNISYVTDPTNDGVDSYQSLNKVYRFTKKGSSTFSTGDTTATSDTSNPSKIRLNFYNSSKLMEANRIHYYVYSSSDLNWDYEAAFSPTYPTSSTDYAYYTLPDVFLSTPGEYYIQIQLLKNREILSEESLNYIYTGGRG